MHRVVSNASLSGTRGEFLISRLANTTLASSLVVFLYIFCGFARGRRAALVLVALRCAFEDVTTALASPRATLGMILYIYIYTYIYMYIYIHMYTYIPYIVYIYMHIFMRRDRERQRDEETNRDGVSYICRDFLLKANQGLAASREQGSKGADVVFRPPPLLFTIARWEAEPKSLRRGVRQVQKESIKGQQQINNNRNPESTRNRFLWELVQFGMGHWIRCAI